MQQPDTICQCSASILAVHLEAVSSAFSSDCCTLHSVLTYAVAQNVKQASSDLQQGRYASTAWGITP